MMRAHCWSFINIAFLLTTVCADCTLNIQNVPPIFSKDIGSRKVVLKKKLGTIKLGEGELLQAFCASGVSLYESNSGLISRFNDLIQIVEFKCMPKSVLGYRALNDRNFEQVNNVAAVGISCRPGLTHHLYESVTALRNCRRPYVTYAIGVSPDTKSDFDDIVTAGICYDLDKLAVKFVTYLLHRPKYDIITESIGAVQLRVVNLDKKIDKLDFYFDFMSQKSFNVSYKALQATHKLLGLYEFDYTNLVQDSVQIHDFAEFEDMLSIVWWRNLRLGNWQHFMDALEERSKTHNYVVHTGTAGVINLPPNPKCNDSTPFSVTVNDVTVQGPKYIWAYLKTQSEDKGEDVVVIGYNSPFYQSTQQVVFCRDMCDEVDWLKTSYLESMRRIVTLGLVFCCRPEDVRLKFDPFPENKIPNVPHIESTVVPAVQHFESTVVPHIESADVARDTFDH